MIAAVAGGSGVAYAMWQNTKDIPVELSGPGGGSGHWTSLRSSTTRATLPWRTNCRQRHRAFTGGSQEEGISFGQQEQYGVGLPKGDVAKCEALTKALKLFLVEGVWETFFTNNLPGVASAGRKPDPNNLDRCNPAP